MEQFMIAINVVTPLVLLIAIGYYAKESKMVTKEAFSSINQLVFKILIPIVLMKNIMETDLGTAFQVDLLIYAIGATFVLTFLLWLIVPLFEKDRSRIGVMIQAIFRSNFVLFGLVIASNMYGADNVAVTSVLIAFCVPLFNVLAVVVLQYYGMDEVNLKSVIKGIFTNPMLVGTWIGFILLLTKIQLPVFLMKTISNVSGMATPLALIVLGGTFELQSVSKNKKALFWITLARLVLVPGVFVSFAIFLGYRQVELISLLVLFGSPTAVSSFAMALAMNGDGDLASQSVLVTTVCSIFSMIFWIFSLTSLGLL